MSQVFALLSKVASQLLFNVLAKLSTQVKVYDRQAPTMYGPTNRLENKSWITFLGLIWKAGSVWAQIRIQKLFVYT